MVQIPAKHLVKCWWRQEWAIWHILAVSGSKNGPFPAGGNGPGLASLLVHLQRFANELVLAVFKGLSQMVVMWFWARAKIRVFEKRSPSKCRTDFWQFVVQSWGFTFFWEVVPKHAQKIDFFYTLQIVRVGGFWEAKWLLVTLGPPKKKLRWAFKPCKPCICYHFLYSPSICFSGLGWLFCFSLLTFGRFTNKLGPSLFCFEWSRVLDGFGRDGAWGAHLT